MKVYRTENHKDKLFFTNYKRISEEIVFNDVMNILKNTPSVSIGDKETYPYEDIYNCDILGEEFELVFDIDYGGYIASSSEKLLEKLEEILNS